MNDPLDFSELLRADFWQYKLHFSHFLNQNPTLFQPVGGMDAIARAFEARVGHLIRYASVVKEIRKTGGGVRIVYAQGSSGDVKAIEADFAICTIPATVLKDIPNDFSPETQAALEGMEFVEAVKVGFQARRRFWEEDEAIYGGISWTDRDITQIWYPSHGYHRAKGVVMGAYIWSKEPGLRFTAMAPAERLEAAVAEGEQLHPGYGKEMECGVSRAWLKAPFQKGAWPRGVRAAGSAPQARRGDPLRRRPGHRLARLAGGSGARRPCGGRGRPREGRARRGLSFGGSGGAGDDELPAGHRTNLGLQCPNHQAT